MHSCLGHGMLVPKIVTGLAANNIRPSFL